MKQDNKKGQFNVINKRSLLTDYLFESKIIFRPTTRTYPEFSIHFNPYAVMAERETQKFKRFCPFAQQKKIFRPG